MTACAAAVALWGVWCAPARAVSITEFPGDTTTLKNPLGIAPGPDGNLWFTDNQNNKIGRITPAGAITEFPNNTTTLNYPNGITAGPRRHPRFAAHINNKKKEITPPGGRTPRSPN